MVARRGKTQARRNSAHNGGLPGWAWLLSGIVLTVAVVLFAPKWLKSGSGDGFFRPSPNPNATPAVASAGAEDVIAEDDAPAATGPVAADTPKATQYDFYTLLPGDEVAMSDAELAATAREEAERQARAQPAAASDTTATTTPATTDPVAAPASPAGASDVATAVPTTPAEAPYILQAGAFGASGDAEATKAKVALLGLSARVESAAINGKTVYRVRMGPYATASELAEAKRKLASGGLPALAIKAK